MRFAPRRSGGSGPAAGQPEPAGRERPAPGPWDPGRQPELALARVHLRTGQLGLARATLEGIAGSGELDLDGLVDLAEARWRTGDLQGAGEAAHAHLDGGGGAPIAYVIAAEATAAAGQPAEARRLAGIALQHVPRPLDAVFAGMPRSLIWPPDDAGAGDAPGAGDATGSAAGASVAGTGTDELRAGRDALRAGAPGLAALHLSLALRVDPSLGPAVLASLEEAVAGLDAALEIVRGDAHRLAGDAQAAERAYASAAALAGR